MTWHDLLFAHWPLDPDCLRPMIPAPLELECFDGRAWIGIVPFHMSGIAARGWPALPGLSSLPEINLRTYVRHGDRRGVYFLSLDAAHWIAVRVARASFGLPYSWARIACRARNGAIDYRSRRRQPRAAAAEFDATYRPSGPVESSPVGSLEHWFTERYALFTADGGTARIGEIHHAPWPLQRAEAEIRRNTLCDAWGITLPECPPLLHFARRLEVVAWRMRPA